VEGEVIFGNKTFSQIVIKANPLYTFGRKVDVSQIYLTHIGCHDDDLERGMFAIK
jgi:hypothetical protein